jgi:hypothetical protein
MNTVPAQIFDRFFQPAEIVAVLPRFQPAPGKFSHSDGIDPGIHDQLSDHDSIHLPFFARDNTRPRNTRKSPPFNNTLPCPPLGGILETGARSESESRFG